MPERISSCAGARQGAIVATQLHAVGPGAGRPHSLVTTGRAVLSVDTAAALFSRWPVILTTDIRPALTRHLRPRAPLPIGSHADIAVISIIRARVSIGRAKAFRFGSFSLDAPESPRFQSEHADWNAPARVECRPNERF